MSERRRIYGDNSSSSSLEPIVIERKPKRESRSPSRRRRVSFSLNPFKRRKSTVVLKESTIRRRRTERSSRTPSPSPSPPRGPHHAMDPRLGDEYVPLPKKLPSKDERSSSSEGDHKKKSRRSKSNVVHQDYHPEDPNAYPFVESSPSTRSPGSRDSRRRDSGIYSLEGSPKPRYYDSQGRLTYGPTVTEQHVQNLTNQLHELEFEKREAQKDAIKAREDAVEAKEALHREKRRSQIERRERDVADKEKQRDPSKRISDVPSQPAREVLIIQQRPPVRPDSGAEAHNRAKEDFKKKRGGYHH